MFVSPKILKLEGQEFVYNSDSKTVVLEIITPFKSAGNKLKWNKEEFGVVGLGVNKSIIEFVKDAHAKLLIRVLSSPGNKDYWITHDKLKHFIKNNNTKYPVSGKIIHVIPWSQFSSKPNFRGNQSS